MDVQRDRAGREIIRKQEEGRKERTLVLIPAQPKLVRTVMHFNSPPSGYNIVDP